MTPRNPFAAALPRGYRDLFCFGLPTMNVRLVAFIALIVAAPLWQALSHWARPQPILVHFLNQDAVLDAAARKELSEVVNMWNRRLLYWRDRTGDYEDATISPPPPGAALVRLPAQLIIQGYVRDNRIDIKDGIRLGLQRAKSVAMELSGMGVPEAALAVVVVTANEINNAHYGNVVAVFSVGPPPPRPL